MSIVNNVKILIKRGSGDPSTSLYQGELGIDTDTNILYIGTGIGSQALNVPKNSDFNQIDASIIRIDASLGLADVTKVYVDGSIVAAIDAVDTSLVAYVDVEFNQIDASIIRIDASLGLADVTKAYVDASLNLKLDNTTDTFTGKLTIDGSLIVTGDIIQDGSSYETHAEQIYTKDDFIIMRDEAIAGIVDPSISGIKVLKADGTNNIILGTGNDAIMRVGWEGDVLQAIATREDTPSDGEYAYWDDSSTLFKTADLQGYIDTSLGLRDVSIGYNLDQVNQHDASIIRIDVSLGISSLDVLTDTSIGTTLADGDVLQYNVDTSTWDNTEVEDAGSYFVLITNFDSSLGIVNSKLNQLDASKANLDTIINVKESAYTLVAGDNNEVIDASGTWTLTCPDDLNTGFQCIIINAGIGTITLDASNLLTTDASVKLSDQYTGATAVHKGSGVWYAFGDLK